MKAKDVLETAMLRSNGQARVVKVPERMRPTVESLRKLEDEIASQIRMNEKICPKQYNQIF